MPELPEVEVVRRGLLSLAGAVVESAEVLDERAITRHAGDAADFEARLTGAALGTPERRGKFLWLPIAERDAALLIHLGMSGQLRLDDEPSEIGAHRHARVRLALRTGSDARFLTFTDQRTFGSLAVDPLVDGAPRQVTHIARDPLDPAFDDRAFIRRLLARRTEVKRALLDQTLVSGIGNIYAD